MWVHKFAHSDWVNRQNRKSVCLQMTFSTHFLSHPYLRTHFNTYFVRNRITTLSQSKDSQKSCYTLQAWEYFFYCIEGDQYWLWDYFFQTIRANKKAHSHKWWDGERPGKLFADNNEVNLKLELDNKNNITGNNNNNNKYLENNTSHEICCGAWENVCMGDAL